MSRWIRRLLLIGAVVPGLVLQTGCLSFVHPVDPLPKHEALETIDIPQACKNRVHIFFVHGLDPLDLGNYSGLHDYFRELGFIKTYYGMPYHSLLFEKEVRHVRQADPEARIVLIGFSYGAGLVRDLACSVRSAGIDIDLLVYLDGVEFGPRPLHRPANVARVLNILSFARSDKRTIEEGENHKYRDAWHFGAVTHPQTVQLLARELADVARRVPIVQYTPLPTPDGPLPAPATLPPPTPVPPDEWGFLKPDNHALGLPGGKPALLAVETPPATLGQPEPPPGTPRPPAQR